jgi:hypothetical protein
MAGTPARFRPDRGHGVTSSAKGNWVWFPADARAQQSAYPFTDRGRHGNCLGVITPPDGHDHPPGGSPVRARDSPPGQRLDRLPRVGGVTPAPAAPVATVPTPPATANVRQLTPAAAGCGETSAYLLVRTVVRRGGSGNDGGAATASNALTIGDSLGYWAASTANPAAMGMGRTLLTRPLGPARQPGHRRQGPASVVPTLRCHRPVRRGRRAAAVRARPTCREEGDHGSVHCKIGDKRILRATEPGRGKWPTTAATATTSPGTF